jgi:hypothetical protein
MPAKTYATNKDPKQDSETVVIREFLGMSPNQDSHDTDPRLASIQINCFSLHPGELRARPGIKLVTFRT